MDDVKLIYTGLDGSAKRMTDGFCDTTFLILSHTYSHKFSPGLLVDQLETEKSMHYLRFDHDILSKLRQEEHGTVPEIVPPHAGTKAYYKEKGIAMTDLADQLK